MTIDELKALKSERDRLDAMYTENCEARKRYQHAMQAIGVDLDKAHQAYEAALKAFGEAL